MDQCTHCTVRGDEKACQETPCSLHESWMVKSLRAQLAEVTRELKVLSDFCEGAEDRALLHKGGLKCLVDFVQKQSDNYARALAAGSKRIAEIHQIEQQLAEVTRERDDYKQAVYDLGLTPEEARAGAKRSRDMKQQLLAAQAHAARLVDTLTVIAEWRLPNTGEVWANGDAISYEANFGSRGAKEFIKEVAAKALSTPINLDVLHEHDAQVMDDVAKHLLTEICFKIGSGSPYRKMLHDYIDTLLREAAAHRARKEQK